MAVSADSDLWHRRFGHQNTEMIRRVAKQTDQFVVEGNDADCLCETCELANHRRQPQDTPKEAEEDAEVGDLVAMDFIGPMSPPARDGSRHVLVFVEKASRHKTSFMCKSRSEAGIHIKDYINRALCPKILRSDNAKEFDTSELTKFYQQNKITRQWSVPREPRQNGLIERAIAHLTTMVRAMLKWSELPATFWGYAWMYATWISNRSMNRSSPRPITPHAALRGEEPVYGLMRTFGCVAYVYSDDTYKSKLDDRGWKGIFIGIPDGTKGWVIYRPTAEQEYVRLHVRFDEHTPGGKLLDSPGASPIPSETPAIEGEPFVENEVALLQPIIPESQDQDPIIPLGRDDTGHPTRIPRAPREWWVVAATYELPPHSWEEALSRHDAVEWKAAAKRELDSAISLNTWKPVSKPIKKRLVGSRWVFSYKRNEEGQILSHKARIVAQGYSQIKGEDYDEVSVPVSTATSLRTILAIAAINGFGKKQLDVKTAYLNAPLEEEIYMRVPPGYIEIMGESSQTTCLKLLKSL